MGAWGISSFDNDDAADWLEELLLADNLLILYSAFEMVDEEYLEFPDACNALAAAEVVLALKGNTRKGVPAKAQQWVQQHQSSATADELAELTKMAIAAVKKVTSPDSELDELWQESEDYDDWLEDIITLKEALKA